MIGLKNNQSDKQKLQLYRYIDIVPSKGLNYFKTYTSTVGVWLMMIIIKNVAPPL